MADYEKLPHPYIFVSVLHRVGLGMQPLVFPLSATLYVHLNFHLDFYFCFYAKPCITHTIVDIEESSREHQSSTN